MTSNLEIFAKKKKSVLLQTTFVYLKNYRRDKNFIIVNMSNIIHVNKNIITLKDNTELNISRSRLAHYRGK